MTIYEYIFFLPKVMTMEDRLSSMTQKMLDLQVQYLDLQVKSAEQLSKLHHKVNELSEQRDLRIGMIEEGNKNNNPLEI